MFLDHKKVEKVWSASLRVYFVAKIGHFELFLDILLHKLAGIMSKKEDQIAKKNCPDEQKRVTISESA